MTAGKCTKMLQITSRGKLHSHNYTVYQKIELLTWPSSGVTECVACNFVLELLPVTVRLHRNDLAGNSASCMKVSLHNASIRVAAGREAEI